jgi:hypothetical protein
LGSYSAPHMLAKLDYRTKEGFLVRRVRHELSQHVGGSPSVTQRLLIERAAILSLRLAQLDRKIVADQHFTILDNNQYLAWANSLARILQQLGLQPAAAAKPTLSDYLASLADEAAA